MGGLLILNSGDVEVFGPIIFSIKMLSEGIFNNYFEFTPKKTSVSLTLNTCKAKVLN